MVVDLKNILIHCYYLNNAYKANREAHKKTADVSAVFIV
ncbi:hypothetical protein P20652_1506 [Pseudoalteromonas sp. BSi20652]|nr:hypothetical protein P20652_1506 [Pseudoalteromonas sp. BSi20652]